MPNVRRTLRKRKPRRNRDNHPLALIQHKTAMKLTIKDAKGNNQGELEVTLPIVEGGKGTQAVHDTVVAYRAAQRMGTACTKNVGEVAGSNKKPWRQKGTGRARA